MLVQLFHCKREGCDRAVWSVEMILSTSGCNGIFLAVATVARKILLNFQGKTEASATCFGVIMTSIEQKRNRIFFLALAPF